MEENKAPLCECGCGMPVKHAQDSKKRWNRYILGHHARGNKGFHHTEEYKKRLSELRKGCIGPNKGKPMKESTKKLLSIAKTGKKLTKEHKDKISKGLLKAYKNPELRKKCSHPPIVTEEHKKRVSNYMLNAWKQPEFRDKLTGKNAFGWLGGLSFEPYGYEFNKSYRKTIREIYNNKCLFCGKDNIENKLILNVHHIDYNKRNNKFSNLIVLCNSCHTKTNYNRPYWITFCNNKLKEIWKGQDTELPLQF